MKKVFLVLSTSLLLIATLSMTSCDNFNYSGKVELDTGATGAAFNRIADVDGDGLKDIVLSQFGSKPAYQGKVVVYYNKSRGIPMYYDFKKEIILDTNEDVCFPNETAIHDIDNDGDMDIFAPSGFISCMAPRLKDGQPVLDENGQPLPVIRHWGLVWFEQKNNEWVQHDLVPYGTSINGVDNLFFHKAEIADIDQDGIKDLITVGETMIIDTQGPPTGPPTGYAETYWFKGTDTEERFEATPRLIGRGGGALPFTYDVDDDGDLDIASAQYFGYMDLLDPQNPMSFDSNAFIWFENIDEGNEWVRHTLSQPMISPNGPPVPVSIFGPSIQLSVIEDLIAEGVDAFIGANHTNSESHPEWPHEAVFMFEINPYAPIWNYKELSREMQSQPNPPYGENGAPGVFDYGDVDGDGDTDIVVSGDGDTKIFVLIQQEEKDERGWPIFETVILDDNLGQAGISVDDITGDGRDDIIVTSFEANKVVIYDYLKYMTNK